MRTFSNRIAELTHHNSRLLFCIFLLLLIFALRYNSVNSPFERDEGDYAYNAMLLLAGSVPYKETFLHKPPFIVYTYAFGQLIDQNGLWVPRVLAIISIFFTTLLITYIAKKESGKFAMYFASTVFVIMSSFPYFTALSANTEIFMILPMTACLAIYVRWRYLKKDTNLRLQFFLFGALFILSLGYKPVSVFPLSLLFIFWLVSLYKKHRSAGEVFTLMLTSFAGMSITFFLTFGYFAYRGAMGDMYDLVISFNRHYVAQFGFSPDFLIQKIWLLIQKWPVLTMATVSTIFTRPKHTAIYAGLIIVSVPAFINTPIGHYYILIMPFWAILAGASVQSMFDFLKIKQPLHIAKSSSILIAIICVVSMLWVVKEQFLMTPHEITLWVYGRQNPFTESQDMAEKVKKYTTPDDLIYVAGSEPQILYYSDRRQASKYEISYPFSMKTSFQRKFQMEAMRDIAKKEPKAIVLCLLDESGFMNVYNETLMKDYILNRIDKDYTLVGGEVWEMGDVYWRDIITADNIGSASLLLFVRN